MDLIYKGINIAILLGLVYWFVRKKAAAHFAQQREDLQKTMKLAASEFEKIEAEYNEISKKVSALDSQLQALKAQSEDSIRKETDRIKKESEQFIQKLSKDAEMRMEKDAQKVGYEFQRELIEAAVASARAELSSKLLKQDEAWTVKMVSDTITAQRNSEKNERANYAS